MIGALSALLHCATARPLLPPALTRMIRWSEGGGFVPVLSIELEKVLHALRD